MEKWVEVAEIASVEKICKPHPSGVFHHSPQASLGWACWQAVAICPKIASERSTSCVGVVHTSKAESARFGRSRRCRRGAFGAGKGVFRVFFEAVVVLEDLVGFGGIEGIFGVFDHGVLGILVGIEFGWERGVGLT